MGMDGQPRGTHANAFDLRTMAGEHPCGGSYDCGGGRLPPGAKRETARALDADTPGVSGKNA
jgi:hypothetical protein